MERDSRQAWLVCGGGALATGLLVLFMLLGRSPAPEARASFGTPTGPPAATPPQSGTTPVGELVDVEVEGDYHCIAWLSSSSPTTVESSTQCYVTTEATPFAGAGGEPPCKAKHTTTDEYTPVRPGEGNCLGHNGPPPFITSAPAKGTGTYSSDAGGTVTIVTCFEDVNSGLGPNVIARLTYTGADALHAAPDGTVKAVGIHLDLWFAQSNAGCTAAEAGTAPTSTANVWGIVITKRASDRDFDGDGCTDYQELVADKIGAGTKCGDDPWNPLDPTGGSPLDVSGSYDIFLRQVRNDVASPGVYYPCKADLQQATKDITARIICYTDSASITVNPQAANGSANDHVFNCPPADPRFCGDGFAGAAPPGCAQAGQNPAVACAARANEGAGCPSLPCDVSQYQFADIDDKHTALTGTLDNTSNAIDLAGCFEDRDGHAVPGNVYLRAKINARTGVGAAIMYPGETFGNCTAGTPAGAGVPVDVNAARQCANANTAPNYTGASCAGTEPTTCTPNAGAGYDDCRDSDGDSCPDKIELSDTQSQGGLRDPLNRWDYFNPEKNTSPHNQGTADVVKTVHQYGKGQGNAAYTIDTDRTAIVGGNVWNLGPPDGQETTADILAAIKQYNQNC